MHTKTKRQAARTFGPKNRNDNPDWRRLPDWLENATETELANLGPSATLAEAVRKYEAYHSKAKAEVDRELCRLVETRILAPTRAVTQAEARRRRSR